ncbi:hypothetical protein BT93_L3106 [Corymbia citriodora subsp. variegata]|uniref:WAT1-related protein n=1 Tax=Corymbia citriodora subsp. variegata TaxID=360336 RepID=A0A8T0CHZ8_CORYI|nr:hypothetical protein BT93_L3106 [Corymbia citriodora subsp. variegata]
MALIQTLKPFILVVFLQLGLAGMDIICKAALNKGTSNYVLVVYRHAVATIAVTPFAIILDRTKGPKMTLPIFIRLMVLGLLEPVIDQNLYYLGMKYTTATFGAAMSNVLPAITFVLACIMRLEKVKMRSIRNQAKVLGTFATVARAMIMTLVKGPVFQLSPTRGGGTTDNHIEKGSSNSEISLQNYIKGSLMITVGMFSQACFMILQAKTLQKYPIELSLTAWICFLGTIEGAVMALVMKRTNTTVWSIHWDTKLLAAVYRGVVCSGVAYYIQGLVMKERGPVFVTAFNPLSMVIVADYKLSSTVTEQTAPPTELADRESKSKDYKLSSTVTQQTAPPTELADGGSKGKDYKLSSPVDEQTATPTELTDRGDKGMDNISHEMIIIADE